MAETPAAQIWTGRLTYLGLAAVILFAQLIPLDEVPSRWAGPDVLLVLTLVFLVRRPDFVPFLSIFAVFLLADLLLQRPPGLWSLLALLGSENLKARGRSLRDANFVAEWITVGLIIIAITFAYRIVLALVLIEVPGLTLSLSELAATILAYPVVVAVTHFLMGVRKAAAGELDALGKRF